VANNEKATYNRFLLLVAGLGGLLYGVDVGIIAGALPYLEATSGLNAGQLSIVVAAVLLGSVISTLSVSYTHLDVYKRQSRSCQRVYEAPRVASPLPSSK